MLPTAEWRFPGPTSAAAGNQGEAFTRLKLFPSKWISGKTRVNLVDTEMFPYEQPTRSGARQDLQRLQKNPPEWLRSAIGNSRVV